MIQVSLTMIVRNEEENLRECLAGVVELVDDVVVVDTGSTDRTREIAASVDGKVRVAEFPWCDDFSAARNEASRLARGEWIFWIDADDRIDAANRSKLARFFGELGPGNAIYTMPYVSRTPWCEGLAPVVPYQRVYRNRPDIRWVGRVFETLQTANPHLNCVTVPVDVTIEHVGYGDLARFVAKVRRNRRLFLLEQDELAARQRAIGIRLQQTEQWLPTLERLAEIDEQLHSTGDAALARQREQLLWRLAHGNERQPSPTSGSTIVIG